MFIYIYIYKYCECFFNITFRITYKYNLIHLPPSAALKIASLINGDVSVTFTTNFSSSTLVSMVSFASASCLFTIYDSSLATILGKMIVNYKINIKILE